MWYGIWSNAVPAEQSPTQVRCCSRAPRKKNCLLFKSSCVYIARLWCLLAAAWARSSKEEIRTDYSAIFWLSVQLLERLQWDIPAHTLPGGSLFYRLIENIVISREKKLEINSDRQLSIMWFMCLGNVVLPETKKGLQKCLRYQFCGWPLLAFSSSQQQR